MRRFPIVSLLLLCCLTSNALAQRQVNRRQPLQSDGAVRITNLVGTIRVHGWDRDSIAVTGEISRRGMGFFMGGDRAAVKLGVDTPSEDVSAADPSTLEVWVPTGSRVRVKSARATIDVANVTGTLDLTSTGGNITVKGVPRELTVESIDGDIALDGAVTWLRARSAGGDIVIRGGAEDLVAASVSGMVAVSGGPVRAARLETMTGAVSFEASIARGAVLDVGTHSGVVAIVLPKGSTPTVEVTTVAAPIENNLTPQRPTARGDAGRDLSLALGGDARLTIRSFKGPVSLAWSGRVKLVAK
jgi:hypothetical protein